MKRDRTQGFAFTAQMGERLRQLRRQAGLTLEDVAYVMGYKDGFASHLSRLEQGKNPNPSMALVADYLRACSASFQDLSPLLAAYTNRPPLRQPRAVEMVEAELKPLGGMESVRLGVYDRKQSSRLSPEARVMAARKQAKAAQERRRLDAMMKDEVNRLGVPPTYVVRKTAHDYARMVWKALDMTGPRPKPKSNRGRPRKTREQRLKEARTRIHALAPRELPFKALKHIEAKVTLLYEDMHRLSDMAAGQGQG